MSYSTKEQKVIAQAYGDTSRSLDEIADNISVSVQIIIKYGKKYGIERRGL